MAANFKKRGRERSTPDSEMFAIYEDLASETEDVRLKAVRKLISRLQAPNSETLESVLKRLIKGVCSSRKGARLGFSVALTEVLIHYGIDAPRISSDGLVSSIEELTRPPSDAVGQEGRDYLIGKVFATQALVTSGFLFNGSESDLAKWNTVLDSLLTVAKKKPWLREECGWVCHQAICRTSGSEKEHNERVSTLLQALVRHALIKTPEGVALWVAARKSCPKVTLPKHVFDQDDPMSSSNRRLLVKIMKEDSSNSDEETVEIQAQRGSWSSAPHFAWGVILSSIIESRSDESQFPQHWRDLVDEGLFAANSSVERKRSGFALLASMAESLPSEYVPPLLSKNIVVNLSQQLATNKGYLQSAAKYALEALLSRAQADPQIVAPVIRRVFSNEAIAKLVLNPNLRIKFLEKMITCVGLDHLEESIEALLAPLHIEQPLEPRRNSQTDSLLALLIARIKSLPYPQDDGKVLKHIRKLYSALLKALMKAAYFDKHPSVKSTGGDTEQDSFFVTQLNNALANLSQKDPDPAHYYILAAKTLGKLDVETEGGTILDAAVQARVQDARGCLKRLTKSDDETETHAKALALLFALCIVQVYNADADSLEALEDLNQCYESFTDTESMDQRAEAADAIVGIVLSFTSKPPTMFKNLAQKAFSMCTEIITDSGLQSMTEVLQAKEDKTGQDEMFDRQDDDEDLDEDIEGADDSDVEMMDADSENEDAEDQMSTSGDEDDESDSDDSEDEEAEDLEDDEDDDEEVIAFDAKLAEALGTRRADNDLAHDEAETSESDMDDDQMEALDEHIATIFKQRKSLDGKSRKKENQEAKEHMIIFKTRVLDLLKTYLNKQSPNPLALHLVVPLVTLVKDTRNAKVRSQAIDLLNYYFKRVKLVNKDAPVDKATRDHAKHLLADVHALVAAKRSKFLQTACSRASLLLVKVYLANGGKVGKVIAQYEQTAERTADEPNRAKDEFFRGWDAWYTSAKKDLVR